MLASFLMGLVGGQRALTPLATVAVASARGELPRADALLLGGHDEWLPAGLAGRRAQYRERTAGLRLLVVVDNARYEAETEPLLPASPHALVIVTSHARLPGLEADDAVSVPLAKYAGAYRRLRAVVDELAELTTRARERAQEADLLRFGVEEVAAAEPLPGEDAVLAAMRATLPADSAA